MIIEMYSLVRYASGEKEARVEAETVQEALEMLAVKYGEEFRKSVYDPDEGLKPGVNIIYRGENITTPEGMKRNIPENEGISLFSSIEGG